MSIARVVAIVQESEDMIGDDIDFHILSDDTISRVYDFIFLAGRSIDKRSMNDEQKDAMINEEVSMNGRSKHIEAVSANALQSVDRRQDHHALTIDKCITQKSINWRQDEWIEIQMPCVESEPKIKYILSKDVVLSLCAAFSQLLVDSVMPNQQEGASITEIFDESPGNKTVDKSASITTVIDESVIDTLDNIRDSSYEADEDSDCSDWDLTMSPTTFHKNLGELLNKNRESTSRPSIDSVCRKLFE